MSLSQEKLDEIQAEAEEYVRGVFKHTEGGEKAIPYLAYVNAASRYAEKLEAVTKAFEELKTRDLGLRMCLEGVSTERDALKADVKRLKEAYLPGNWEKLEDIKTQLEAVTKERDEVRQVNSHLNEKIDAWKIIADDHANGRLKRAEECNALKSQLAEERQYSEKLREAFGRIQFFKNCMACEEHLIIKRQALVLKRPSEEGK